jgi:hypothetical protein
VPPAIAHGRRGPHGHTPVITPAPTAHGSTLPPLPAQAPAPQEPRDRDEDTDSEPDVPPAAMPAPIDDVDG